MLANEALLNGMKQDGERAMSISKISAVLQGPHEISSQFCERLCEAFPLFIPFDLEAAENQ